MSIINSLKDYLSSYKKMSIKTDLISKETGTYAIALTGNDKVKTDILGIKTYGNNYVFYARENTLDEIDRQGNHDFIEKLQEWIEDNNDKGIFPNLGTKYKVTEISVANGILFDVDKDGSGIYQVQIKLIIKKEA